MMECILDYIQLRNSHKKVVYLATLHYSIPVNPTIHNGYESSPPVEVFAIVGQ